MSGQPRPSFIAGLGDEGSVTLARKTVRRSTMPGSTTIEPGARMARITRINNALINAKGKEGRKF
jgi:hypothetical protein